MRRALRWSLVSLVSSLALTAVATAQPPFTGGQDPSAGATVFSAKGCVRCHAVDGVGGKGGPDLGRTTRHRSFADLASAFWNHAPRMAARMREVGIPRRALDPHEAGDLAAVLYTRGYFDPPGRAARGSEARRGAIVATNKGCLDCHGLYGERGKHAGDLTQATTIDTPAGVLASLWNHTFIIDGRAERQRTPWPVFRAQDMADLIASLRSVRRAPAASASER